VTLTEALKIRQQNNKDAPLFSVKLACGFTPLHLQTFLAAHLQQALPLRNIEITPGSYGDLAGCLEDASINQMHGVLVALEWSDLDPRLGYRGSGSWAPRILPDIVAEARRMLGRIGAAFERIAVPVAISLPTLALPPIFHTTGEQAGELEWTLQRSAAEFAERVAQFPGVRIVSTLRLDENSPAVTRFDLKSDLSTGLPYTLSHADALAYLLARVLAPPAPKKGLITDLDDTLWNGIVGELGPEGVSWDLASHHQLHGLYQKLLATFSEEGTLVAVASKNDAATVAKAFERNDLLLRPQQVFPMEVHWNAKSGSVERILRTWNIGADSVVFVDDSPMELAEVAAAHPGIECVRFPTNDDREGYRMLRRLRDLFGKQRLSSEDALRLESIRQGAAFQQGAAAGASPESFLEQAQARITIEFSAAGDPRVLELVNKTNQFNLNGVRYTESDWQRKLAAPGAFLAVISYEDKFGPLGKIAVIQGRAESGKLHVSTWVMSCRAFSRRIEFQTMKTLFERHDAREMVFDFASTAKNGPTQEFFAGVLGSNPVPPVYFTPELFAEKCPRLYHQVETLLTI
jgi:FkbH-like protein